MNSIQHENKNISRIIWNTWTMKEFIWQVTMNENQWEYRNMVVDLIWKTCLAKKRRWSTLFFSIQLLDRYLSFNQHNDAETHDLTVLVPKKMAFACVGIGISLNEYPCKDEYFLHDSVCRLQEKIICALDGNFYCIPTVYDYLQLLDPFTWRNDLIIFSKETFFFNTMESFVSFTKKNQAFIRYPTYVQALVYFRIPKSSLEWISLTPSQEQTVQSCQECFVDLSFDKMFERLSIDQVKSVSCQQNVKVPHKTIERIGDGSYGTVVQCYANNNLCPLKKMVAVKHFYAKRFDGRDFVREESILREIGIMSCPWFYNHKNIACATEVYCNAKKWSIVMPFYNGGNLRVALASKRYGFEEKRSILKDMFVGIGYLHAHGVCHRDVKPENIMLNMTDNNVTATIVDFSLSRFSTSPSVNTNMTGNICTIWYRAPEILEPNYNQTKKSVYVMYNGIYLDLWSMGLIVGEVFYEKPIFACQDHTLHSQYDLYQQFFSSTKAKKNFMENVFESVPQPYDDHVQDLFLQLTKKCPFQRMMASEAEFHDFFF